MEDRNSIRVNLTPFYAAALAHAPNIKEDIDNLYSKKAEEYYMAAKDSEFYGCRMCKEGSLLAEELFKKCLGLLCYANENDDEETLDGIRNLFKKAYRKTYRFLLDKGIGTVSDKEYFCEMAPYLSHLEHDAFFGNLSAFLFISEGPCEGMVKIGHMIAELYRYYFDGRDGLRKSMKEREKELNTLCKAVPPDALHALSCLKKDDETGLHVIYMSESLCSTSLFNGMQMDRRDMKEIAFSYLHEKECGRECDFRTYFRFALHLKAMCRAYNKVKEMYFENNKETMYVEMGALKKELQEANAALGSQVARNKQLSESESGRNQKLMQENTQLQKQVRRMQDEMSRMQSDSKEAAALREYVFSQASLEPGNDTGPEDAADIGRLDGLKGVVIGGFPGWQNKVKDKLRSWQFVSAGVNTLDKDLLRNADVVVFNTRCLNHDLYYKAMDIVRNGHAQIGYINNDNVSRGMDAIYKALFPKAG